MARFDEFDVQSKLLLRKLWKELTRSYIEALNEIQDEPIRKHFQAVHEQTLQSIDRRGVDSLPREIELAIVRALDEHGEGIRAADISEFDLDIYLDSGYVLEWELKSVRFASHRPPESEEMPAIDLEQLGG